MREITVSQLVETRPHSLSHYTSMCNRDLLEDERAAAYISAMIDDEDSYWVVIYLKGQILLMHEKWESLNYVLIGNENECAWRLHKESMLRNIDIENWFNKKINEIENDLLFS